MAAEEQIKALAYALWEHEACPEGKHEDHYYRAKQILEEQGATRGVDYEPTTLVINLPPRARKSKKTAHRKKA